MNDHLHTVGSFVDKKVRMMRSRLAEHIHDAGQCFIPFIRTGSHIEWLDRKPGRINADHLASSRNSGAH